MEPEFICGSCDHTFDSEPPFHERPEHCPRCRSDEITTIKQYDENMRINND